MNRKNIGALRKRGLGRLAVLGLAGVLAGPAVASPDQAPKFSHPRDITNPYLPLASLKQDILEGKEGGDVLLKSHTTRKAPWTKVNYDAFEEASKDLLNLAEVAMGGGEQVH